MINVFSVCWTIVLGVMVCFPPALPVTLGSMNYSSVIVVGIFGIFVALWYAIGVRFEGPNIDLVALSEANAVCKRRN